MNRDTSLGQNTQERAPLGSTKSQSKCTILQREPRKISWIDIYWYKIFVYNNVEIWEWIAAKSLIQAKAIQSLRFSFEVYIIQNDNPEKVVWVVVKQKRMPHVQNVSFWENRVKTFCILLEWLTDNNTTWATNNGGNQLHTFIYPG